MLSRSTTSSLTNRRVAMALYASTIAFAAAHMTNAFVADALYVPPNQAQAAIEWTDPVTAVDLSQESADTILRSGLFLLPPPSTDNLREGSQAPPPPPLDAAKKVALLGTVHGREGGVMAVIEDIATKQQTLYRVGSPVPNVGTLAVVEKHRVLFREDTREEWLDLALGKQAQTDSAQPGPNPTGHTPATLRRVLDRREINAALADPTRLLTQAQAVPYLTEGKLDGFRLYSVMPMGFFDKIGLQTNDILQRINGVELRDPSMVLSLIQQLRNERTVRVDLVRNTQRQTLTYEIR